MTTLRAELKAERDASEAERAATASEHAASLEANAKSSHASLQERQEAEHEKRVVHIQQSAARRIANRYIMIGFTTWQGQWEEAARQKRMLAAAAARLARPALAAAVAHWVGDWRAAEAAAADAAKQLLASSSTLERSQLLYACTLRNL